VPRQVQAIFRGRLFIVTESSAKGIWLERSVNQRTRQRLFVTFADPDLIEKPGAEDLDLAEMFERGDVRAFEYADGHTFPPGQEIRPRRSGLRCRSFPTH
jgi:hypothetical protein